MQLLPRGYSVSDSSALLVDVHGERLGKESRKKARQPRLAAAEIGNHRHLVRERSVPCDPIENTGRNEDCRRQTFPREVKKLRQNFFWQMHDPSRPNHLLGPRELEVICPHAARTEIHFDERYDSRLVDPLVLRA